MVATDGGSLTFLERWKWMVFGPASWPAAASSQRSLMISFWTLASTWWEHDRGRRDRGSKDAYPPFSNLSSSLSIQLRDTLWVRASSLGLPWSTTTASTMYR